MTQIFEWKNSDGFLGESQSGRHGSPALNGLLFLRKLKEQRAGASDGNYGDNRGNCASSLRRGGFGRQSFAFGRRGRIADFVVVKIDDAQLDAVFDLHCA